MFSPEDVNLIMRAIAEDAKIQQMKQQIEDETSGLDLAEQTGGDGAEGEETVMETLAGESVPGEKTPGESGPEEAEKKEGIVSRETADTGKAADDRKKK